MRIRVQGLGIGVQGVGFRALKPLDSSPDPPRTFM